MFNMEPAVPMVSKTVGTVGARYSIHRCTEHAHQLHQQVDKVGSKWCCVASWNIQLHQTRRSFLYPFVALFVHRADTQLTFFLKLVVFVIILYCFSLAVHTCYGSICVIQAEAAFIISFHSTR